MISYTMLSTMIFQSTLPYGSDSDPDSNLHRDYRFQSTLPYGSDSRATLACKAEENFNPRSLTGATA